MTPTQLRSRRTTVCTEAVDPAVVRVTVVGELRETAAVQLRLTLDEILSRLPDATTIAWDLGSVHVCTAAARAQLRRMRVRGGRVPAHRVLTKSPDLRAIFTAVSNARCFEDRADFDAEIGDRLREAA